MAVRLIFIRPIEGNAGKWSVTQVERAGGESTECPGENAARTFVRMLGYTHKSMLVITYSRRDVVSDVHAFKNGRWRRINIE